MYVNICLFFFLSAMCPHLSTCRHQYSHLNSDVALVKCVLQYTGVQCDPNPFVSRKTCLIDWCKDTKPRFHKFGSQCSQCVWLLHGFKSGWHLWGDECLGFCFIGYHIWKSWNRNCRHTLSMSLSACPLSDYIYISLLNDIKLAE